MPGSDRARAFELQRIIAFAVEIAGIVEPLDEELAAQFRAILKTTVRNPRPSRQAHAQRTESSADRCQGRCRLALTETERVPAPDKQLAPATRFLVGDDHGVAIDRELRGAQPGDGFIGGRLGAIADLEKEG